MSYPKIIGITGRKYNGKDTIGDYLVLKYGYKRLAFADALKASCKEIFGFSDEQLYGNEKETIDDFWKVSPRVVLQYVGTELFRTHIHEIIPFVKTNIWVEVIRRKIFDEQKKFPDKRFVITDMRFANENEFIKSINGLSLRVTRECVNTSIDIHPSELEIEKLIVDYELHNNSTLENLHTQVDQIFNSIFLKV